jgi:multiple sugar transport system permease protein
MGQKRPHPADSGGWNAMLAQSRRVGWLLVAPLVLLFLVLTVYPFAYMFYISFFDYNLAEGGSPVFYGVQNYASILTDPIATSTIDFTMRLVTIALPIEMLFGLGAALLARDILGGRLVRSLILLPMMIPAVVAGVAWKMLYNFDFGPLNYLLSLLNIAKQSWLGSHDLAQLSVILIEVWQWTPFVFLILYAGLQATPWEIVEAARIDGASSWGIVRYIEVPLLRPLILVVLLIRLIDILKLFDIIYMTTWGGPGSATHTFSYYIYKVGLSYGWDVGYAAALSVVLLVVVTILVNVLIRALQVPALLGLEESQ